MFRVLRWMSTVSEQTPGLGSSILDSLIASFGILRAQRDLGRVSFVPSTDILDAQ